MSSDKTREQELETARLKEAERVRLRNEEVAAAKRDYRNPLNYPDTGFVSTSDRDAAILKANAERQPLAFGAPLNRSYLVDAGVYTTTDLRRQITEHMAQITALLAQLGGPDPFIRDGEDVVVRSQERDALAEAATIRAGEGPIVKIPGQPLSDAEVAAIARQKQQDELDGVERGVVPNGPYKDVYLNDKYLTDKGKAEEKS